MTIFPMLYDTSLLITLYLMVHTSYSSTPILPLPFNFLKKFLGDFILQNIIYWSYLSYKTNLPWALMFVEVLSPFFSFTIKTSSKVAKLLIPEFLTFYSMLEGNTFNKTNINPCLHWLETIWWLWVTLKKIKPSTVKHKTLCILLLPYYSHPKPLLL